MVYICAGVCLMPYILTFSYWKRPKKSVLLLAWADVKRAKIINRKNKIIINNEASIASPLINKKR